MTIEATLPAIADAASAEARYPDRARSDAGISRASGFVIGSPTGETGGQAEVVTAAHAVLGSTEIFVIVDGRRRLRAELVGLDSRADVALLRLTPESAASDSGAAVASEKRLVPAAVGSASRLCIGQRVVAVGSPYGLGQSSSAGIVSAWPRQPPGAQGVSLIQTDVALNEGSSGGPLFDEHGAVVGMNTMIFSGTGTFTGVSFAVPIDTILRSVAALRLQGHVVRGSIGATTQPLTWPLAEVFGRGDLRGALVLRVSPGGPADRAGLQSADIVLGIDGVALMDYAEIQERVASAQPGSELDLRVWRRHAPVRLHAIVDSVAQDRPQRSAGTTAAGSSAASIRAEIPALPVPRLGLDLDDRPGVQVLSGIKPGLYVRAATGPSRSAGLRYGDEVLGINDVRVESIAQFDAALAQFVASHSIALLVRRGTATNFVSISTVPAARAAAGSAGLPD
ncbi:Trypsin [Burkholderiales bacterium 8X]|nr:Trypsin [Burkholderiales bacterium 8X]